MPVTVLDPKSALLVLDLQKGVAAYPMVHPVAEVVKRVNALSGAFRPKGLPVVLVVVDGVPPGRTEAARPDTEFSADWTEFVPELDRQPEDLRVTKKTSGAFARTGLEDTLRSLDVTQVVIVGMATGGAVDSTARQAYELGFNVTFAVDAMTDASLERHQYTIGTVLPRLGETGTTQDILNLLEETH